MQLTFNGIAVQKTPKGYVASYKGEKTEPHPTLAEALQHCRVLLTNTDLNRSLNYFSKVFELRANLLKYRALGLEPENPLEASNLRNRSQTLKNLSKKLQKAKRYTFSP